MMDGTPHRPARARCPVWAIFFGLTLALLGARTALGAVPARPIRSMWRWGEPIRSILVRGCGRRASLSDPTALRYLARDMRPGPRANVRNGPPAVGLPMSTYQAWIRFADGTVMDRQVYAMRFPRVLAFSFQPQRAEGGIPIAPLYRPLPTALRRFWRFLATPGETGSRRFGRLRPRPVAGPAQRESVKSWRLRARSWRNGFTADFPGSAFCIRLGQHFLRISGDASYGFLARSGGFIPSGAFSRLSSAGTCWWAASFSMRGQRDSRLVIGACRYPRSLVVALPPAAGRAAGSGWKFVCPLYGPLPPGLYSCYEKLVHLKPVAGRLARGRPSGGGRRRLAGEREDGDPKLLAGTRRTIVRAVFTKSGATVAALSDVGSLGYLQSVQRYYRYGYRGRQPGGTYAVTIWVRGRKRPRFALVAAQRFPRELIFVPGRAKLRNSFLDRAQVRCPLYGPLPTALFAAYRRLVRPRLVRAAGAKRGHAVREPKRGRK